MATPTGSWELTDRREIVAKVAGSTYRNVSTTVFGLGLNFDQDQLPGFLYP